MVKVLQKTLTLSSTLILKTVLKMILSNDMVLLFRKKFIRQKMFGEFRTNFTTLSNFPKKFILSKLFGNVPFL